MSPENHHIQEVFNLLPDVVVSVNKQGVITTCNQAVERVLGYHSNELVNKPVSVLIPERFRKDHGEHIASYFNHADPRKMGAGMRLYALRKDGKEIDIDIALSRYEHKGETYAITVLREITDKVMLEQKVDTLERVKTELERFAYTLSHDLKSPLQRVKMLTELITADLNPEENADTKKMVQFLHDSVDTMDRLIKGILEYTRAEHPVIHDGVDLNDVLAEVLSVIVKPENFEVKVPGPLPALHGNKTQLFQVFLNLISNAIKFNKRDKGILSISWEKLPNSFQFTFEDNGTIVPVEEREKIFRPFTRGAAAADHDSHGLGLSIVKKIIEQAGGSITYRESTLGGSAFVFEWPELNQPSV